MLVFSTSFWDNDQVLGNKQTKIGRSYIMKKSILAAVLATSMGAHASGDYTGEYLELICTIDGIPGKEVSVPTSNYEYKNVTESVGLTFEWEYEVTDRSYIRSINTRTINDYVREMSRDRMEVDRMTGAYERVRWEGSLVNLLNHQLYGKPLYPAETVEKGTCEPGAHSKTAKF